MAVNDEDENEVVFCLTDIDGELPEGFYDDNEEFNDEEDGFEIISEYGTLWKKLWVSMKCAEWLVGLYPFWENLLM